MARLFLPPHKFARRPYWCHGLQTLEKCPGGQKGMDIEWYDVRAEFNENSSFHLYHDVRS
jgi:hypothetical protein